MIDLLYPVRGDCVHKGYNYVLYAALKSVDPDLACDIAIWYGPLEHVTPHRKLLMLGRRSVWRVRAPEDRVSALMCYVGPKLRVGDHAITLGMPSIQPVRPSADIWCAAMALRCRGFQQGRGCPTPRDLRCRLLDTMTRLGVATPRVTIEVGKRYHLMIAASQWVYPVGLYGLTDEESIWIQTTTIGGRKHMGAGLFVPGRIPRWALGNAHTRRSPTSDPQRPRRRIYCGGAVAR